MLIILLGSYLLGSLPTAYLAGKQSGGKDLSRSGTGTAGAANVWHSVSRKMGLLVFLADVLKGAIPPLVIRQFDLGPSLQVAGGLASIAGHNWSIFLGFRGGRGVATVVGMMLALAPKEALIIVAVGLAGIPLHQTAVSVLTAIALIPLLCWYFGESRVVVLGGVAVLALIIAKRLEANRKRMTPGAGKGRVLLYRFLYDRDIKDRKAWIRGKRQ